MGCIIGSLAASAACCFCGSAASLCCACLPKCKSSTSTRIMYGVVLLIGTAISCICLSPGLRTTLSKIPALCEPLKIQFVETDISAGLNCDILVGFGAVYRIGFTLACFFFLLTIIMFNVKSSKDPRAYVQNGFWAFKLLAIIGLAIGAFYIPAESDFNRVWMYISLVGGFLFILVQLVLFIDFAHGWNQAWVDAGSENDDKRYFIGLLVFTILFYVSSLAIIIALYVFYGHSGCPLNQFFISFNMLGCLCLSVLSVLPSVQERLPHSGLLQSSILTLYVVYMTWSSMNNIPDVTCNPFLVVKNITLLSNKESTSTAILDFNSGTLVSLVIFVLTVVNSTIRNSANTNALKLNLMSNESVILADDFAAGDNHSEQVYDNERDGVTYSYSVFHLMFLLAAMYIQMTLTCWLEPERSDLTTLYANYASVWVKMVSTWCCMLIYAWSLLAPMLFPDRDFT